MIFFVVQMIFFWCAGKFFFLACSTNFCREFDAFWPKFCRLMAQVLPPYGASFAGLRCKLCCLVASTNKQSAVQKSVAFSLGGGCVCVDLGQHAAVKNI